MPLHWRFVTRRLTLCLHLLPFVAVQERYHSLAPMYYRGAASAIIVYDLTNRVRRGTRTALHNTRRPHHLLTSRFACSLVRIQQSFVRAKTWVKELQKQPLNPNIVIALAGNKLDLADKRQVDAEVCRARNLAQSAMLLVDSLRSVFHLLSLTGGEGVRRRKRSDVPRDVGQGMFALHSARFALSRAHRCVAVLCVHCVRCRPTTM